MINLISLGADINLFKPDSEKRASEDYKNVDAELPDYSSLASSIKAVLVGFIHDINKTIVKIEK